MNITQKKRPVGRPRADGRPPVQKSDVLRAAIKLFALHGFAGTSVRMIADELSIHPPSIFHHFDTKLHILNEIIAHFEKYHLEHYKIIRKEKASAPAKLYKTIWLDTNAIIMLGRDYYAIFNFPEVRNQTIGPLAEWQKLTASHYKALIDDGIRQGDFIKTHSATIADAVYATCESPMSSLQSPLTNRLTQSEYLADFNLRGLLKNPSRLDKIKLEAHSLPNAEKFFRALQDSDLFLLFTDNPNSDYSR